jgi:hypothetical protein
MEKIIHLKLSTNSHYDYFGMHVPKEMDSSELLKIIGATELIRCDHCTGNPRFNEKYRNSGKLEDRGTYEIHSDDIKNTMDLIQDYKDKNETIAHANNTNHTLDLMNSYKDEN